jgi:pimeloyl-ACP methyl ester carboxylesterase
MRPFSVIGVALLVLGCAVPDGPRTATSADGVPIRYDLHGTGDTLLVLIHGWTNTRAFWDPHPATLARTHRVAVLDLAGHGESGAARTDWSVRRFGDDVVAVVESAGADRVVLVGFSLGACAALEAAAMLGDRAIGVVIVDALQDVATTFTEADIARVAAQMRGVLADPMAVRAFALSPAAHDSLAARLVRLVPASTPDHAWESLASSLRWRTSELRGTVGRVRSPIVAINSDRVATDVRTWRELSPGFELRVMSGVGHLGVLWERPEEFDRLLLESVSALATARR